VNGIVNIITKRAQDTQGVLVSSRVGDEERSSASVRYGGKLGNATSYRIYSRYFDDGPAGTLNGQPAHDSSRMMSGGFRVDSSVSSRDAFMLEGQGFSGTNGVESLGFSYHPPFSSGFVDHWTQQGENVMGRWTHKSLGGSETTLQTSYAHVIHPNLALDVNGDVAIITLQHEHPLGTRHDLVTGVEYDFKNARTSSPQTLIWWDPSNPTTKIASAYVQDEMLFANGDIRVTAGFRLEHTNVTGFAWHPNVRALWKLSPLHTVWMAYSSANLTPGPDDTGMQLNLAAFPGPAATQVLRMVGNPNIGPENLHALEMGYRFEPVKNLSLDFATFVNRYTKLIAPELGQPFFEAGPPPRLVLPLVDQNALQGNTFGGELAARWTPAKAVRFAAAYSFIQMDMTQSAHVFGDPAHELEGETPRHRLALNSSVDLVPTVTLNTMLTFNDRRTALDIPGYTRVDSALCWRPVSRGELRIGARNLFNKEHVELFDRRSGPSTELGRTVYVRGVWRF
jgi:iron complex outermembrane recepter protein